MTINHIPNCYHVYKSNVHACVKPPYTRVYQNSYPHSLVFSRLQGHVPISGTTVTRETPCKRTLIRDC